MARRHGKGLDGAALQERVSLAHAAGADPLRTLIELAKTIAKGFDAMGCDIYRKLPDDDALQAAAAWPAPEQADGSWLGVKYPLVVWPSFRTVLESPVPTQVRVDSPDLAERERLDLAAWGIGATMGVRLESGGRVVGCLVVSRKKARDFDREDLEALQRCAGPVAAALDWAASVS